MTPYRYQFKQISPPTIATMPPVRIIDGGGIAGLGSAGSTMVKVGVASIAVAGLALFAATRLAK